jgi:hypothetical protein
MISVSLHLRVHAVIVMLLLLLLSWLQWRLMVIRIDVVAGNDTDLLVVLVETSNTVLFCVF